MPILVTRPPTPSGSERSVPALWHAEEIALVADAVHSGPVHRLGVPRVDVGAHHGDALGQADRGPGGEHRAARLAGAGGGDLHHHVGAAAAGLGDGDVARGSAPRRRWR